MTAGALAVALGIGVVATALGTGVAAADPTESSGSSAGHSTAHVGPAHTGVGPRRDAARPARRAVAAKTSGLTAFFNNRTPSLHPVQTGQTDTGSVTGELNAVDPDSPRLTYTVARNPVHGTVSINPDGHYTYTTDPMLSQIGTADSFTVTVSDAASGFAIHGLAGLINLLSFGLIGQNGDSSTKSVAVNVAPFMSGNNPPTATVIVGDPDPNSGVVSGIVVGSDPDGDPLTYSGSSTSRGAVVVQPTGSFTYTPTSAARQAAAADGATIAETTDTVSLTITDKYGAATTIPITVAVSPAVVAPENRDYVLISHADLMSKPTTGAGWEFLKAQADSTWETPNLSADNTTVQTKVLAAALVYARTGDVSYRDKVLAAVNAVPGTEADATIVLPLARTIFGYVMAADLVDMPLDTVADNGQTWRSFLEQARVEEFDGNTRWISLDKTAGDSSGNWNAYSLSSHLAISIVLGDDSAVQRDIDIYRRFLGDTTSPWPAFKPSAGYVWNNFGKTWDATPTLQRGINPDVPGDPRNGAIIIDASRSTNFPSVTCCQMNLAGRAYTEESLDALVTINMVLKSQGYDFTDFEDKALLRAYEFLVNHGGPSGYSNGRYLAMVMNSWYGTDFDTSAGDSVARHLGFGGWLF